MRVLLIEQADFMAAALQDAIRAQEHRVTWLTSIRSLDPLVGARDITLGSIGKRSSGTPYAIGSQFHLALVDALTGDACDGPAVVKALTAYGIPCVAAAALKEPNDAMLAAGAVLAMPKGILLGALCLGHLPIERAVDPSAQLRTELALFAHTFKHHAKEERDPGEELVHAFLHHR